MIGPLEVQHDTDHIQQQKPRTYRAEQGDDRNADEIRAIANEMPLRPQIRFAVAARRGSIA